MGGQRAAGLDACVAWRSQPLSGTLAALPFPLVLCTLAELDTKETAYDATKKELEALTAELEGI